MWKVLGSDDIHLSKIILNTRVASEGQIQGNAEGSQEGTQGQHQDPRARCSSFPFLQALPILGGSLSRTSPKGRGGWDSCATPPHLKSLLPSPRSSTSGCSWGTSRWLPAFLRHGTHVARAGVVVGSWPLVLWTSHFPSPTAARAGATRSPAGGADPMDTPPCESQLPRRRKRQSRHCPEHSWAPFLSRASQRRRPPRLRPLDTVLPCRPGMRAAPATAWQPQVGSRRSAPQPLAPGSCAPGPWDSLTPPSQH